MTTPHFAKATELDLQPHDLIHDPSGTAFYRVKEVWADDGRVTVEEFTQDGWREVASLRISTLANFIVARPIVWVQQMIQWAIYDHPTDYPRHFVCRQWVIAGETVMPGACVLFETLEEARAFIPDGMTCIPQQPSDDPKIVETGTENAS